MVMKLKKWLWEYRNMTYGEYKNLPECERYGFQGEHQYFCLMEQMKKRENWRPMTPEDSTHYAEFAERERKRYAVNLKIGGIDSCGNYTALHHRHY